MSEYTPIEQAELTKTRLIHDAELLRGGASIASSGVLQSTSDQIETMRNSYGEFTKTADHGMIKRHFIALNSLEAHLGTHLGHESSSKAYMPLSRLLDHMYNFDLGKPAREGEQGIDFDKIFVHPQISDSETVFNDRQPAEIERTWKILHEERTPQIALIQTRDILVSNPHVRSGNKVKVMHQDGFEQSNWYVRGVLGNGNMFVSRTRMGMLQAKRSIRPAQLLEWNPQSEEEIAD